ncbi:MAG: hypothetical protein MUP28_00300 [Candidatus Aminicenantes bacterium]|nr:hypothetical protein [Candidatus Aminicenantes bacterium]
MEIQKRYLVRAQNLGDLLQQMGRHGLGRPGNRQPLDPLRIQNKDPVILVGVLNAVKPTENPVPNIRVRGSLQEAFDQSGKGPVPVKGRSIRKLFFSPLDQLAHFQLCDGRKPALDLAAEILRVATIEEISGSDDARRQDKKNQEKIERRAVFSSVERLRV